MHYKGYRSQPRSKYSQWRKLYLGEGVGERFLLRTVSQHSFLALFYCQTSLNLSRPEMCMYERRSVFSKFVLSLLK